MHYAITQRLSQRHSWKDPASLTFGALLPDAVPPAQRSRASHFVASREDRRTYDVGEFRRLFGSRLEEEGLYLGYYLHLVQDSAYRQFLYCQYDLHCNTPAQFEQLYRDYSILNRYLIEKDGLAPVTACPEGIADAEICKQFGLEPKLLLADLNGDFTRDTQGEAEVFTREMADEYMEYAQKLCETELAALEQGRPLLDPWALAWNTRRDT